VRRPSTAPKLVRRVLTDRNFRMGWLVVSKKRALRRSRSRWALDVLMPATSSVAVPRGNPSESMVTSAPIARTWRLRALIELARMDLASTELGRLEAVAEATRLPLARWHALRAKAATAILRGDFAVVSELHEEATAIAVASGDIVAANIGAAAVFEMAVRRGVRLPTELFIAAELAPPSPLIEAPLALILLDMGRTDEARIIYERLVPLLGVQTTVRPWSPVLYPLLNLAERFGDSAAASLLVDELAAHVEGVVGGVGTSTVWFVGNPRLQLGRALALAGRDGEALPILQEALRLNQRIGARPDVALTRIELARVLSRLGDLPESRRTNSQAALDQARRAVDECRGLDMPGHADRAEALVRELDRTLSANDPLSPREREVVDLVLAGLTNQDIAQRLFLSERTVESHVRNILMKLGCRNRTELIRLWS
jgi:DNA-binding CsgD family transcriptional regulator